MQNLLTLFDVTKSDIGQIFAITRDLKTKLEKGVRESLLPGRVLALLFEKPSLRTRVSFEAGMVHLGGSSLFLGQEVGWQTREAAADFGQVLGRYVDGIVCRAKCHGRVEELAQYSPCPVINGLTDRAHPCQALADLYTLGEVHGTLQGAKLTYIGDANNVARSLAVACGHLGVAFVLAAPPKYQFDEDFRRRLAQQFPDQELSVTTDPLEAVRDSHGIYTDVWTSMGQEAEQQERRSAFAPYQVNEKLMAAAPEGACFLHCLPARRGEEVTDYVMDGSQSAVIAQAANRMHVQKGILVWLLGRAHS